MSDNHLIPPPVCLCGRKPLHILAMVNINTQLDAGHSSQWAKCQEMRSGPGGEEVQL